MSLLATIRPETRDPERLVYGQCECCGRPQTRKARDRNRMHFDCWADHHCGPDNPWPPGHQCWHQPGPDRDSTPSSGRGNRG